MNSESTGSLTSVSYLNQLQKTVPGACTNSKKMLPMGMILNYISFQRVIVFN